MMLKPRGIWKPFLMNQDSPDMTVRGITVEKSTLLMVLDLLMSMISLAMKMEYLPVRRVLSIIAASSVEKDLVRTSKCSLMRRIAIPNSEST